MKINIKKNKNSHNIKLIFVGRVGRNKKILTTIKACKILINKGYKVSLNIIEIIKDKKYYFYLIYML